MSSLNKLLKEELQKVPQHFLYLVIEEKLREHDIDDAELTQAFTDHVISGNSEPFHWDDGNDGEAKKLNFVLSEKDIEDMGNKVRAFLADDLPKVIMKTVQDSAKLAVKDLEKRWPEVKVEERNEMRSFRDRLDLRWAAGLDPLRMMLIASREIGQEFAEKLARSKAKKGLTTREAIMILHMRVCQTTMEILTLLENGLPDGAYARWRTLYELSVIAFVVDRFGDEVAERYLAHDAVSMRESLVNEFVHNGKAYELAKLRGASREIEEDFQAVVREFGKSFAGPYGWAAHSLGIKSPRFRDLEEAVDWNALPPNYKWSSYKVHAGVSGTIRSLGSIGDQQIIHTGATNAGLETPVINTAYSLMHVTSLVFGKLNELETQIQMQSLVVLRDTVVKKSLQAARILEEELLEGQYEAGL